MDFRIAVLPGDGIGPEVTTEGARILEAVGKRFGHRFSFDRGLIGGCSIDQTGTALGDDTLSMCRATDAVLLGAVGGPKWDNPSAKTRPEDGLLRLRRELKLFANLRPVKAFAQLVDSTPLKRDVVRDVDMVVIRELTGGLYFGRPKRRWQNSRGRRSVDTLSYTEAEVTRVLRVGFDLARSRRRKLLSVDKANVLETSRMWREIATELASEYPEVELRHMLVDTCAMEMVKNPSAFDVVVTENTFGDILTDEAAILAGSMGMLPSASLGAQSSTKQLGKDAPRSFGLYEPIHGSAPDIAGQDKANPIATILSIALMLRYSLSRHDEAAAVEAAVEEVLEDGHRTTDIGDASSKVVGTQAMGGLITDRLKNSG